MLLLNAPEINDTFLELVLYRDDDSNCCCDRRAARISTVLPNDVAMVDIFILLAITTSAILSYPEEVNERRDKRTFLKKLRKNEDARRKTKPLY